MCWSFLLLVEKPFSQISHVKFLITLDDSMLKTKTILKSTFKMSCPALNSDLIFPWESFSLIAKKILDYYCYYRNV